MTRNLSYSDVVKKSNVNIYQVLSDDYVPETPVKKKKIRKVKDSIPVQFRLLKEDVPRVQRYVGNQFTGMMVKPLPIDEKNPNEFGIPMMGDLPIRGLYKISGNTNTCPDIDYEIYAELLISETENSLIVTPVKIRGISTKTFYNTHGSCTFEDWTERKKEKNDHMAEGAMRKYIMKNFQDYILQDMFTMWRGTKQPPRKKMILKNLNVQRYEDIDIVYIDDMFNKWHKIIRRRDILQTIEQVKKDVKAGLLDESRIAAWEKFLDDC